MSTTYNPLAGYSSSLVKPPQLPDAPIPMNNKTNKERDKYAK